ncbi:MAG TPA: HD domain-containing phosphohydrolase [Phycisphaerae bacterium]|nr:HD domain-containing phosphohydrolase [Phycisphaerae bacterium]
MLPGGKTLSVDDVDILRKKYPEAMLKVGDPVLDSVVQFEDDTKDREVATTVTQQISSAMADVQQKFSSHTNLSGIDFGGIRNTVSAVIDFLKNNPVSAALMTRMGTDQSYLAEHAGNVFYLSMVLGSGVKDYVVKERQRQTAASNLSSSVAMDLMPLGLGAMLMDIGMTPLQHLFKPGHMLTDEDRKAIIEHPKAGADMLPDSLPAAAKMIVRWHHENFDGSGYPEKKAGSSLHVFVRIARICDAFDAATSEKCYRQPKTPVRALWEMTYGPYRKYYDPVLMKVFASIIQPFPIGAKLKLTDGRTGVVVKYNRKMPFQPTVVVAFDPDGNRLTADKLEGPLNVGEENDLRLERYGEEDLRYVRETSEIQVDRAAGHRFADLMEAVFP